MMIDIKMVETLYWLRIQWASGRSVYRTLPCIIGMQDFIFTRGRRLDGWAFQFCQNRQQIFVFPTSLVQLLLCIMYTIVPIYSVPVYQCGKQGRCSRVYHSLISDRKLSEVHQTVNVSSD